MDRLAREIDVYQRIAELVRCKPGQEVGELCKELSINEKTLFRYLQAAQDKIKLEDICYKGKNLSVLRVEEYNLTQDKRESSELSRTTRLTKLLDLLNQTTPQGGLTIDEIVNKLGVTARTIYRDLDALEGYLNVILIRPERSMGQRGKYKLANTYLPPISPDKALFIYLSILQQKSTALTVGIREIKAALIGSLTQNRYSIKDIPIDKLEQRIYIVDQMLTEPEKVSDNFIKIIKAIENSNVINISYFKSYNQELSNRQLEPYGLVCKHHNWYLIARCLEKKDLRTFRVDQIEQVGISMKKFEYPHEFNLKSYIESSWGVILDQQVKEVKVKFDSGVAYRLEKIKYHSSQEIIEKLQDGSIIVRFTITGITEFVGWLLQWRTSAIVLEPSDLVERMKEEIGKLHKQYC